jgi:colicin import membrane protein
MNRLQKKCVIASAGFHLLLLLILFIGPAFLSSRSKGDALPVLDFIPSKLIDSPFVGGGNPNAALPPPAQQPPVAQPPQPAPQPPQQKAAPLEPPKEVVKTSPNALDTKADTKSRRPAVNTNLMARPRNDAATAKQLAQADAEAKAAADARKRAADQVGKAVASLRGGLSLGTTVEMFGPGGGGETYASYDAYIRTVYMQAWIEPEGVSDNPPTPKASVTIARDGTVISARLTQPSGNAVVDRAVVTTLNRVKFIAPFPEGSKDEQRSYTINFTLELKKLL